MKDNAGFVMSKDSLTHAIRLGYGLDIEDLEFLLRGFGGDCYRAETRAGESYFLKLHDPVANQMMAASSRPFYLPLMDQLHAKGILSNIPHPLPTVDSRLSLKIEANELVITNFIEGELVGFGELPETVLAQLAEQVGILHRSRGELEFKSPFIDQFEIVFEHDLPRSFDALFALDETASPGQVLLRDSVLPHQVKIVAALHKLKGLQEYVQKSTKPKVVCHTDLHGGNLMTDNQGELYILDWENAMIAPLEHDMIFFAGRKDFFKIFWPNYAREFPAASIDLDLLRFYFCRRGLEDIADFILRILRRDGNFERDEQDIKWMLECIHDLEQIENTISRLANGFC